MNLDDATNSAAADDTDTSTVADDTGVDTEGQQADDQPELDDDGNPIDPPEESEEIEHEGKKYAVPKALKPLLLMQADYTKKTQEVAAERQAFQAERTSFHQASQAEIDAYADVKQASQDIAQFQQIDWDAWEQRAMYDDEDKARLRIAERQFLKAKEARQSGLNTLSQLKSQRDFQTQQSLAKRMEEGRAVLTREVPGWGDEHKAKLLTFAAGFGFSRAELDDLEADPRVAKVLDAAFRGSTTTRQAKTVQSHLAAQAVQPAAKVVTARAPASGLDDRLSPDEWVRRRNAQLRKSAGR